MLYIKEAGFTEPSSIFLAPYLELFINIVGVHSEASPLWGEHSCSSLMGDMFLNHFCSPSLCSLQCALASLLTGTPETQVLPHQCWAERKDPPLKLMQCWALHSPGYLWSSLVQGLTAGSCSAWCLLGPQIFFCSTRIITLNNLTLSILHFSDESVLS